jgi:hypothetical protein
MGYMTKMSEQLKAAIENSGQHRREIARNAGAGEAGRISMLRWLNGTQRTITSELIDTLCEYLGLELRPKADTDKGDK